MKLTRFRKLDKAVNNLDWNAIANEMKNVADLLNHEGIPFKPQDTSLTEEGIYYINPKSGMSTRTVLYNPVQRVSYEQFSAKADKRKGFTDEETLNSLNVYHLTRCAALHQEELQGWRYDYQILRRSDNHFPYWIISHNPAERRPLDRERFLARQQLRICPLCLVKINSLLTKKIPYTQKNFYPSYFFDAGFDNTWARPIVYSKERGILGDMHPRDWENITQTRMKQVKHHCEECDIDLSRKALQEFLSIYHHDYISNKISYLKLRCLCIGCKAEIPGKEGLKESAKYKYFIQHQNDLF